MCSKYLTYFLIFVCLTFELQAKEKKREFSLSIKKPNQIRDPFKRPLMERGVKEGPKVGKFLKNNSYSNLPTLDKVPLESIVIVGVLLGKRRQAIARILKNGTPSKETYRLTEGMKLGDNGAEIKAILPGGIVLGEKMVNVYDQDEYIETVIPISSDL